MFRVTLLQTAGKMKNLCNEVNRLIIEFALTDCEAGDLSAFADTLGYCFNLTDEAIVAHVEMRVEVLARVGSEMDEMYSAMEKWGQERKK